MDWPSRRPEGGRDNGGGDTGDGSDAVGGERGGGSDVAGGQNSAVGEESDVRGTNARGSGSSSDECGETSGGSSGSTTSSGGGQMNPIARWAFLTGERSAVVGILSLGVFVGLVGLGIAGVVDVSRADRVSTAFSTTVTGLFTLVSVTVSINQLVLSRVLGSPEHIRDRIESVESFRDGVAGESERVTVAPTEPAAFLEVVTRSLRVHARRLDDLFDDRHDPQTQTCVSEFVAELVDLTDAVDDRIGSDRLRLFDVLLPVLGNRYSSHIHAVDRIRATTEGLSAAEERALAELREALVEINRTRHYFKTLYLHEALSSLSRLILVTGVGALLLCYVTMLSYGAPGGTAGSRSLHLLGVSAALAVALSPLAVLFAYGVRVATIASQTTTFGTFTPVEEFP